jgi:hypothetical protein
MESLIFLVEKCNGRVKARTYANGSTQCAYMEHDDATSLTAMTEAIDFDHHHDQCQAEA